MLNSNLVKSVLEKIKSNKNSLLWLLASLAIFSTILLVVDNFDIGEMPQKKIVDKSIDYLNKSVLQEGQTAELISFSEESGLIKVKIKIDGRDYDSYISEDGKLFFPEALEIESEGNEVVAE